MKIGISTSVVQRGQTGIAQYLFALLRAFSNLNLNLNPNIGSHGNAPHKFLLFVLRKDLPLFDEFRNTMQIVPVSEAFRPPVLNIAWHQTVLPRLARQHSLDVLHVPSYRRLMHAHPCATVATIHDLAPFHVTAKYDPLRMFYARTIVRRLAHRQHCIIAISRNTARDIFRFFDIARDRVRVIYNGLDHHRFRPNPNLNLNLNPSPFFLYVSRLEHPGKNHVRLIAAFDQFKQSTGSPWQLVFAGKDWNGADAIHAAIRSSPFARDIRCLGFVSDADLPSLYHAAGAFVYPSLYEGFGMPPVEAMACGLPVLCSDRGALAEVIGDAALIVDPEDIPDLARKLRAMATDPDLRARLRERGLRQARRFDWNETAAATLDVYQRTIALYSGRPLSSIPDLRRRLIKPLSPRSSIPVTPDLRTKSR